MHELPIRDDVVCNASLRADGRMVHEFYIFQMKTPEQSTSPWDLYSLVDTIPGNLAFRPLAQGGCPAVRE